MRKPIFIVQTNDQTLSSGLALSDLADEYHLIVLYESSFKETKFQLFSDREIEPIKLEELKEILKLKEEPLEV